MCFAQYSDTLFIPYSKDFKFNEGIYLNFNDFKYNQPSITVPLEKSGSDVFIKVSDDSVAAINPLKVWGYSYDNNIYISSEGVFWKCINIGRLTQFTEVRVRTQFTASPYGYGYGYNNQIQTKSLAQSFLDIETGEIKAMTFKNLKPYIEDEPSLKQYHKKRGIKHKEMIVLLRYYNQLNPINFPVYE